MDAPQDLPGLGGSIAVTFLSLGLVCLLAFLFLRWLGRRGGGQGRGPIRVLARCPLEPRRSLFLVEAAGRCFLIGSGDSAMTMLAEVDPAEIKGLAPASPPGVGFAQVLARVLGRSPQGPGAGPDVPAERREP
jgi:flagellar biosynthetic protein FliO